ncbi:MAG: hypothetical protein QOK16_1752 [Solirubrobacteraceae bacterium]|jgi:hypothetical protein|nr:hypothetical protein [Solirubrobacteraceae bacterium]MEA2186741.1 hypothetical protein [Solirubrobacteraceae bacterium]
MNPQWWRLCDHGMHAGVATGAVHNGVSPGESVTYEDPGVQ